jgi:flagellar hook-associated protein 3 FlgL
MTRISSQGMFDQAVAAMQVRQSQLARTQLQLATGNRMLTAQDDPVAAGMASMLDRADAVLTQFGKNADSLGHRLRLEETALTSVSDRISRVKELAIQANSGTQSQQSRAAIVSELRTHFDALLAESNSTDGSGRFLFAGSTDGSPPFVVNAGAVGYVGDQTQRRIEIAAELSVADVDPGSEIFMRVPTGRDGIVARANAANTGGAVINSSGLVDSAQWDGGSYRVRFNAGTYDVLDAGSAIIVSGSYVPGQAISFRGVQLSVQGAPANGDIFDVAPAPSRDLFASVNMLIDTLQLPDQTAPQRATIQNRIYAAIEDLNSAQEHLIDRRTQVGARLSTVDLAASERESQQLEHRTLLSELRDLDYTEAASRMSLQLTALEAAQTAFVRVQSLSLFSLLR